MFIVLEIQTDKNGTVGILPYQFTEENKAENKYHNVLAAASVSSLPVHAAVMMTEYGIEIKKEFYEHQEVAE